MRYFTAKELEFIFHGMKVAGCCVSSHHFDGNTHSMSIARMVDEVHRGPDCVWYLRMMEPLDGTPTLKNPTGLRGLHVSWIKGELVGGVLKEEA